MSFVEVERDFIRRFLPDFEWLSFESPSQPVPLRKPAHQCRVALVTTSGAYLKTGQPPFDTKNRLGDDSFRIIPGETPTAAIGLSHPGYDTRRALKDPDCVFPLALLRQIREQGAVGEVAPRHLAFMGFIPKPQRLLEERAPEAARLLLEDGVDLALLVPS